MPRERLVCRLLGAYFGTKAKTQADYENRRTLLATEFAKAFEQEAGKRLATHADIEKVLNEVKAVTRETETIRAQIGGDLWVRQAVWSLKQRFLYELLESSNSLRAKFVQFGGHLAAGMRLPGAHDAEGLVHQGLVELTKQFGLAQVLLDKETLDLLEPIMIQFGGILDFSNPDVGQLAKGVLDAWWKALVRPARKELRKGSSTD